MNANASSTKQRAARLPTMDDVASGKLTLDEYETAHGEDIPELTATDLAAARPMAVMFPEITEAFERMRGQRGPQKALVKERVGLRLDAEIVNHFRASGKGWQARINAILARHISKAGK